MEYGLFYDVEALEKFYEDLQEELQDETIYDDNNDFDHILLDSRAQHLLPVIPNIVMLALAFLLTCTIPFVSQGLLRGVYLLKTILLGLSNALVITAILLTPEIYKDQIEDGKYSLVQRALQVTVGFKTA